MDATSKINKIKTLLGMEVEFETKTLENGTTFESESFSKGQEVFILTEDEKIPVPVGEYSFTDGYTLKVEEEGVVASLGDYKDKKEEEEEMEDAEERREKKGEADVQDWAGMEKRIKNLEDAVADLKKDKVEAEDEVEEEEAKAEEKEELSAQPGVEAFKHSPEKESQKTQLTTWGNKQRMSVEERVFNQIFNS